MYKSFYNKKEEKVERKTAKHEFNKCNCCKGSGQCQCCQGDGQTETKFRIVHLIPEDRDIVDESKGKYDRMRKKYDEIGFKLFMAFMLTFIAWIFLGMITYSFLILIGTAVPFAFFCLTFIFFRKSNDWRQKYLKVRNEIASKYGIKEKEIFVLK